MIFESWGTIALLFALGQEKQKVSQANNISN